MNENPKIALADLKRRFSVIRDAAADALRDIEIAEELRSGRWMCEACGQVKIFASPVPIRNCGTCPNCGKEFYEDGGPMLID